ncbi:uncharacterized protein LOC106132271 [Amyelois transitella]|uniref:uncharacterized protein LOC106132271 n=1 Tax=Amyelois transitella TaxID=680683 RepID=UPI00067B6C51|nr:uncharacterized protein LOC106132271 [Amyelois transitella]
METDTRISLIDLTKQFPFELDKQVKKDIAFSETLVISCGHLEGDVCDESSDSEWSCQDSTDNESTAEEKKEDAPFEVKDFVPEEAADEDIEEEDNDFHFYFFPDCNKPKPPKNSRTSIITQDGFPKINPELQKVRIVCSCNLDKKTGKCDCLVKLPCECGAETLAVCTCAKAKSICICHDKPYKECICKESDVCLCRPDAIKPICPCETCVDKPCVCRPKVFPSPDCECKKKPKLSDNTTSVSSYKGEYDDEECPIETIHEEKTEPCVCQKPDPKPICKCLLGDDCVCKQDACVCDIVKSCICTKTDSKDPLCNDEDSKSVCVCPIHDECRCAASAVGGDCECFPKKLCTCGDPENCKCQRICDCTEPCVCDTKPVIEECTCAKTKKLPIPACTCKKLDAGNKLKRVRAGKHGYRWCHDVDPRHTFFDYGYDQHDKISYKEQLRERIKIYGLHEEKSEEETVCAVHEVKAPPYKKKVRKPSIDCCSAVGGISICVECLGEDRGKFLVQVVSHSSKEGAKTGSKLVSIVDCNLHTMEENRTEYITKRELTKERRSYISICESGYYNKVTRICGERHMVKRFYHTFESSKQFLLEGANVVLLRYLGLRRYRGNIKTETVLMNGLICESIYVCLGVSQAIVNGKPLFVCKIERHIIEPSGFVHQTLTVLTLRGYIVSHEWADNNYILHLNPLLRIVPEKDEIEPHVPLRATWREDLQLLSDYLDFKSSRTSEGARYVSENGALSGAVKDYLQALLLLKPQDALHFTRHYFGAALSALDLPHNEYFDPASRHVRYFFFEE